MPFPDFDPIVSIGSFQLKFGAFALRWYALAYVAGILLGWRYALGLVKRETLWGPRGAPATGPQIDDLILWITLGIIAGGRLGYVIFYQPSILGQIFTGPGLGDRLAIFKLWEGGMAFHGGLIGVILAILWFSRQQVEPRPAWFSPPHRDQLLRLGDLVAPCVPIGLFFGRIANFINGELWGRPTDAPWGVVFCNDRIRQTMGSCPAGLEPRHPSQLYEAALEGLLLFALLRFASHHRGWLQRPGLVSGLFLLGYGLSRALMELVREPDLHMPEALRGLVTMGMLLSIPMILGGAWLVWRALGDDLRGRSPNRAG